MALQYNVDIKIPWNPLAHWLDAADTVYSYSYKTSRETPHRTAAHCLHFELVLTAYSMAGGLSELKGGGNPNCY